MNPADNLEHLIKEFQVTTNIETDRRILEDAFVALERSAPEVSAGLGPAIRRVMGYPRAMELAALAAIVLIAFALFFRTLSVRAIGLGQVYQALQKTENVCVSTYTDAQAEPIQQVWTSRPLQVVMYKSQAGEQARFDLVDIPNRLKKTRYSTSVTINTERLASEAVISAERSIRDVFELVPFSSMDSAPEGSRWNKVPQDYARASVPGTQVYELTWAVERSCYKCCIFVDAKSHLPRRTEYYFKEKPEDQYKFESMQVAAYPAEKEIKLLIREIFGPDEGRSGEPGYIGTPEHHLQGSGKE